MIQFFGHEFWTLPTSSPPRFSESEKLQKMCFTPTVSESPTFDAERYVLADGTTVGFDFELAKARVPHAIPEHVKGRFIELEKAEKAAKKAAEAQ